MGSYWAGYHGDALVFNEDEFLQFCKNYCEISRANKTELQEQIDACGIRDYDFIRSSSLPEGKTFFQIVDILTDECDGMLLIPFILNGKPNIYEPNKSRIKCKDLRSENCYVVFSDKSRSDAKAFLDQPYSSYDEFVQEFKNKLEKYLPDNFDWDDHIGEFSYAACD